MRGRYKSVHVFTRVSVFCFGGVWGSAVRVRGRVSGQGRVRAECASSARTAVEASAVCEGTGAVVGRAVGDGVGVGPHVKIGALGGRERERLDGGHGERLGRERKEGSGERGERGSKMVDTVQWGRVGG